MHNKHIELIIQKIPNPNCPKFIGLNEAISHKKFEVIFIKSAKHAANTTSPNETLSSAFGLFLILKNCRNTLFKAYEPKSYKFL